MAMVEATELKLRLRQDVWECNARMKTAAYKTPRQHTRRRSAQETVTEVLILETE